VTNGEWHLLHESLLQRIVARIVAPGAAAPKNTSAEKRDDLSSSGRGC
jgi:hypothetical protein